MAPKFGEAYISLIEVQKPYFRVRPTYVFKKNNKSRNGKVFKNVSQPFLKWHDNSIDIGQTEEVVY